MFFILKIVKLLSFGLFVSSAERHSNFKFLGCFLEENLLSLGDESRTTTPMSPEYCSRFCSGKQYLFFILKHDSCYCSKNYISRLMKQFDHECTKKCAGDELYSCGGQHVVSSYITDSTLSSNFLQHGGYPIPIYLGCYSETPNDAENRLLKGPARPYVDNTPMECSKICFKMGYLYFGVTYGSECWCGNQKPLSSLQVEEINCNSPCSGNNKQMCGGGWKMGIYSTGLTDYLPKKYVGCFENDERKPKGKYLAYEMGKNSSPRRCMNLCNTQRFKYASVKGETCECKNYEVNFSLKRSFSDCQTVCSENPSEYCGGSITSSIYRTLFNDPQGKVSVYHMGCFETVRRHPILHGWKITFNKLTPKYCVYSCYARRFPYAALTSSKECVCSFIKPADEAKTEDSECTISCSGSQYHSCGGYYSMNVYSTGMEWKTKAVGNYYLGCFEESQNNRIFNSYAQSFLTNTPEMCSNLCYKLGYTYSGVTYKDGCFCGSRSPNELNFPKVEEKQCDTKCSGDANQFCGGGWRMGVFSTGLNDFSTEDRLLGCFIQEEDTLPDMKFELINTNTPNKCSAICNNAGYKFAGVMSVNCFCSNLASKNDLKVDNSDCDISCVGASSETCGGESRLQIYDLQLPKKEDSTNTSSSPPEPVNFEDEFNSLTLGSHWSHEIYVPQEPDYEFAIYNNSEKNAYLQNGELIIKPTISSDNFVRKGCLNLKGCTKSGSYECSKNASSFNIIPPVMSAKLTTRNYFTSLYGQIEVVAKLPAGDWIVSEISLISISNEQNRLILATLFGNSNLKCNGVDESELVLKYGLKIDEQYHVTPKIMKSVKTNPWTDDYHSFEVIWSPENTIFKIDGERNYLDTSNLPLDSIFDSNFYLSIGVSVGGITNFRDGCLSNGHLKPWTNQDPKAMFLFWKDKSHWEPTWNEEKSTLRVKKVKFTATNIVT